MKKTSSNIITSDAKEIISSVGDSFLKLKNMTVLVTGANGVVGSYIVHALATANKTKFKKTPVTCICITRHSVKRSSRLGDLIDERHVQFMTKDVTKRFRLPQKPDYIIHTASYASPKTYLKKPIETMEANSLGTKRLLELARSYRCKNMLFISSAAVYGESNSHQKPFTEDHPGYVSPLEARAIYTESKRFGETLCMIYANFFGVHTTIARLSNMFGPGFMLDDGRAIPDFFNQAFTTNEIKVNDPKSVRAYLYITDAVSAIFDILLSGGKGQTYNISQERGISMYEIAHEISSFFSNCHLSISKNKGKSYLQSSPKFTVTSSQKLRRELNWRPCVSMHRGLQRLYAWYNGERV